MTYLMKMPSPVGQLHLASDGEAITGLWIEGQKYFAATLDSDIREQPELPPFYQAVDWLTAYFAQKPLPLMPPLAPKGSSFRQAVWQQLLAIPYGFTTTYGRLASTLRTPGFPRRPGGRRCGGAQSHLHSDPLPPGCGR